MMISSTGLKRPIISHPGKRGRPSCSSDLAAIRLLMRITIMCSTIQIFQAYVCFPVRSNCLTTFGSSRGASANLLY